MNREALQNRGLYRLRDPRLEHSMSVLGNELEARRHLPPALPPRTLADSTVGSMAVSGANRNVGPSGWLTSWAWEPAEALLSTLRRHRQRRQAIRELRRLPARLLADIGIDRAQIRDVVDQMMAESSDDAECGEGATVAKHWAPRTDWRSSATA